MEAKIDEMASTLAETRVQIAGLNEPMDLNASCANWRKERVAGENIHDPVSAKLRDHQATVQKAQQALASQQASEAANLQHLRERREQILEDLRDKTAAINIDRGCIGNSAHHLAHDELETNPPRSDFSRLRGVHAHAPHDSYTRQSLRQHPLEHERDVNERRHDHTSKWHAADVMAEFGKTGFGSGRSEKVSGWLTPQQTPRMNPRHFMSFAEGSTSPLTARPRASSARPGSLQQSGFQQLAAR